VTVGFNQGKDSGRGIRTGEKAFKKSIEAIRLY
jgi:hypothetical protein